MRVLTAMHDIVLVAVVQGTSNLSRKFSRNAFPQAAMTDDVVEHLPAIDVLEHHVVVVLVDNHLTHATNIRMMQKHGESSFTNGSNFL